MIRRLFIAAVLVATAGCSESSDSDVVKKKALQADAELRHFTVTREPRLVDEAPTWEVSVRFGIPECYGFLTYYEDGRVILYAFVPAPDGGQEKRQADDPDANTLDPGLFGMCFPER